MFIDFGTIKAASSGTKSVYFFSVVAAPWSVKVVCYGAAGLEQIQVTAPGAAMIGSNSDDFITWEISADRWYHIAVAGVEFDGTF